MRRLGDILELRDADCPLASRAIAGLASDSRKTVPGDVFFALAGVKDNGLKHVGEALAKGAAAVVAERCTAIPNAAFVRVADARAALAKAAARFYPRPAGDDRRRDRHQRKNFGRRLRAPDLASARPQRGLDRDDRRRVAPADRLRVADDAGPDRPASAHRPAHRERRHASRYGGLLARPCSEAARRRAPRRRRIYQSDSRPHGLPRDHRGLS